MTLARNPDTRTDADADAGATPPPTAEPPRADANPTPTPTPNPTPGLLHPLVLALFAFAFLPWLLAWLRHLGNQPYAGHFPLVFIGAVVLAARNLRQAPPVTDPPRVGPALLAIAAWLGLALACLLSATRFSLWLALASGALLLLALAARRGGLRDIRAAFPALLMAALLVPMPFGIDTRILLALQRVAANGSSFLLDRFGVVHWLSGVIIEIPNHRLMIEQACSGIESLVTLLPAALFFAAWLRRPALHIAALLPMAVVLDLVANIVRITTCAMAQYFFEIDLFTGTPHTIIGILLFAGTLALVASADQFLLWLRDAPQESESESESETESEPESQPRPARDVLAGLLRIRPLPRALPLALGVAFAALGAAAWSRPAVRGSLDNSAPWWKPALGDTLRTYQLPDALDGWRALPVPPEDALVHRESTHHLGEWTRQYRYANERLAALVSIDYPFQGWHDLATCYVGSGWTPESQSLRADDPHPRMLVHMTRIGANRGLLLFGLADDAGHWLEPPHSVRGLAELFAQRASRPRSWYQVQVLVNKNGPFEPDEIDDVDRLFRAVADELDRSLFKTAPRS